MKDKIGLGQFYHTHIFLFWKTENLDQEKFQKYEATSKLCELIISILTEYLFSFNQQFIHNIDFNLLHNSLTIRPLWTDVMPIERSF